MTINVFPESIPQLGIQLDSLEWFEWLANQTQFKYEGNLTTMSVKRRASNGKWYARKKVYSSDKGSVPVDLYIGGNEECTAEKLREINYRFGQDWRDFWPWYHSPARRGEKGKSVQQEMSTSTANPSQTGEEIAQLREEVRRLGAELNLVRQMRDTAQSKYDRVAEDNGRLIRLVREAQAEIERLQSSGNSPGLEKIRDRVLVAHPPKDRRKLKLALDQFISQCASKLPAGD